MTSKKARTANSTYPKVAVQWLNQALCFYQSFCWVDSEVLRNRPPSGSCKPLADIVLKIGKTRKSEKNLEN